MRASDVEQRARELLIRSESGVFTDKMRAGRGHWLDPRHRIVYLRIMGTWRRSGRLRSIRPLDGSVDPDLLRNPTLTSVPQITSSISGIRILTVLLFPIVGVQGFLLGRWNSGVHIHLAPWIDCAAVLLGPWCAAWAASRLISAALQEVNRHAIAVSWTAAAVFLYLEILITLLKVSRML
jgi:hypothetical protein